MVGISLAMTLAYVIRFSGWPIPLVHDVPNFHLYLSVYPVIGLVLLICNQYAGLYIQKRGISSVDELPRIIRAATVTFLILIGLTYFYSRGLYSRVVLVYAWLLTVIILTAGRSTLRRLQINLRRRGIGITRVVIVGLTSAGNNAANQIKRYPGLGYRLVGMVAEDENARTAAEADLSAPIVGTLAELEQVIGNHRIDEVVFALPASRHEQMQTAILKIQEMGIALKIISDLFGIITNPLSVDEINGIPIFALKEAPLTKVSARFKKRCFDLLVTIPALIILSPLLLIIAIAVKWSSPGPVLFKQERIGRDNLPFKIMKFRSMRQDAEARSGPVWATKRDDRSTKVGSFLRKTSLDELPQFFNILKGEMSLVGPRPERPFFVDQFKQEIPNYLERHKVKAGLTGWAQVHGLRGNTPIEERTKYDLWYVENWSLILDVKIILKTGLEFLHHHDAY